MLSAVRECSFAIVRNFWEGAVTCCQGRAFLIEAQRSHWTHHSNSLLLSSLLGPLGNEDHKPAAIMAHAINPIPIETEKAVVCS